MGRSYSTEDESSDSGQKIIMHPLYLPKMPPWFDLRVFYVRVSNCVVNESTPQQLKVSHIPLTPDTILEVNGKRTGIYSDCVFSMLRRDRVDKNLEGVTYVSTDSIRMTSSVRFEVFDGDELLLTGVLELCNGFSGESRSLNKKWSMKCQPVMSFTRFMKGKQYMSVETPLPKIEVYVAGSFLSIPIILTKTLQLSFRMNNMKKLVLDSIPEYETTEMKKEVTFEDPLQVSKYHDCKTDNAMPNDYSSIYSRAEYMEGEEDGQLSWFNAGVRVGVGISLGICLGLGIGVGVLVRTYQATTRNFKRGRI